ncbi:MAG: ATP-binding cassette domain-containing protein [Planctomycetes bacterium]|nr:ATP-binding cassette domain-containing protein [Planctomycetota bacterium]
MPLLTLRDVRRTVMDRPILDGVDLVLDEGVRVGLLGPNGSGKSTLMRIAAGVEVPDTGERVLQRDLVLGYLPQEPRVEPTLSVRDAVRAGLGDRDSVLARLDVVHRRLEGTCHDKGELDALLAESTRLEDELAAMGGYDPEHRVESLIADLGLPDADAICGSLSGGERRRVALARLLLGSPTLLLLDEPTNHLDVETIAWLEDWLAQQKAALLLVTHDRYVLDRVCQRIVELEQGRLIAYEGGYLDYLDLRAARLEAERRVESARCNMLRRETAWMRRGAPARTTKARARIQRFEQLVTAAPPPPDGELLFAIPPGPRMGSRVVRFERVSKAFAGRTILDALDLELQPRARLGVIGPNGAGKTTFLKLLTGEIAPDSGTVHLGETVRFASIDQERTALDPEATVVQEVAGEGTGVRVGDRVQRVESFLDRFLFPGPRKYTLVKDLSGGERNRVLLAKLLLQGGNLLVLDEPTNDLDLMTLRALEEALAAFAGTVVVVSHDRSFVDRVATHVLYLDGRGRQRVDHCSASAVLARVAAEREDETLRAREAKSEGSGARAVSGRREASVGGASMTPSAGATSSASPPPGAGPSSAEASAPSPARKRLSNWERDELAALPAKLEAAEAQLVALDARLANPALYAGPESERKKVQAAHDAASGEVARLYARWEELETREG